MSEETTTEQKDVTENASAEPQQAEQAPENNLGDAGKKALDTMKAERNAAKRERDALKAQLDEIEKANMTELEKAQRSAQEAQAELDRIRSQSLRQQVALSKGVPAELVDRLRGDTEDELNADAEALLALIGAPRSPKPDPSQGGSGTSHLPLNGDGIEAALRSKLGI